MAYNVSGLSDFVKENENVLVKDAVLGTEGGETIPVISKALGIKGKERLHPLSIAPTLQASVGCGFNAQGSTTISEREIETAEMKINDQFCPSDLDGKFAEYQLTIDADKNADLPFEAEIMGEYVKGVNKEIEKLIWKGDKNSGDLIDGFITIAENADSASTITGSTSVGASAYEAVKETLALIPEELMDEAVIFVGPAIFRAYQQDLVAANLYHYNVGDGDKNEMFIPGSSVKVRKASGLAGVSKLYATNPKNMVYGCDLLNAREEFKTWYSEDNDVVRVRAKWNAGVQTLFPDYVVLVTKN